MATLQRATGAHSLAHSGIHLMPALAKQFGRESVS